MTTETLELITQIILLLLGSAIPALAAAWFTHRGGEVLADAFRPMSGQKVALEQGWPRGVQEEEPRSWGGAGPAWQVGVPGRDREAPTEGNQLPELQPVRTGRRPSRTDD